MITVTINGKKIELERTVTILEAATSVGIKIPTLCHHEMLEPYGGCRLCLVEVEKMPRLQTSCTQYVTDGMVVWTETDRVVEARKAMLEFLLINHPLDCPYCDKAGECDLQDLTMKHGPATGRFIEGKRTHPESYDDPIIVRNMERCILCARCVRMCDKVQGASAISITNRGSKSFVEPFSGGRYNCEYCGNCLTVCPVGAIMSRLHKHTYRPWYIDKEVNTICSYCGVGCSMVAQVRGDSLIRVVPKADLGLNKGLLCNRGYFGHDYLKGPERLNTPLIKKNGELQRATWSEAFNYVANRLKEIKEKYGSNAIAGIASGRCANEDNYVLQKFIRVVIGSNNIDSTASFAYAPAQRFFEMIFGQGVTANPIHGITNSDGVFVIGGDLSAINPVLGMQIRAASQRGVPVITLGYMPGLKRYAAANLTPNPFTETTLLASMVSALMEKRPLSKVNVLFEGIIKEAPRVSLEKAEEICGIGLKEISYAIDTMSAMTNPSIIIGRGILQSAEGHTNMFFLAVLIYLLNGRIYLLSELPNEQGLLDMGCQPDMLPGCGPITIESFRKRYEEFVGSVPSVPGMGLMEIIEGASSNKIKAIYVMGENVAFNIPDNKYVKDALSNVELLVVQDIFFNETTGLAHAVLPSLAWLEKDGTYTNLERRMQLVKKAVKATGMEDWRIIAEISRILGYDLNYKSSEDIMSEIAKVSPLHKDITYKDVSSGECMWPYKGEPLRHGVNIEGIKLPDIETLLKMPDKDKVYAMLDMPLFHSESLSRNSSALNSISPEPYVKISKALADRLSASQGDYVSVSTEIGAVELPVVIDPELPENIVLIPNNFKDKGIFKIMKWKKNPRIKSPAMDGTKIVIKKIKGVENVSDEGVPN